MSGERSKGATSSLPINLSAPRARVFILSDVRLYRESLLWNLTRSQAFEMLGAADLSTAAVARVIGLQPDSIILDIGAVESFATAKLLGISLPRVKVIAFAVSEIDPLVLA